MLLDSIFIQIPSDANTLLGIGALVTAVISVIMLIVTITQSNETKNLQFIKDVDDDLSEQLEKESSLHGRDSCIVYAYNYIDICDRVLFLINKRTISKEFIDYYSDFFSYASTIMWWYSTIYPEDQHSIKHSWPSLTKWIIDDSIVPYPIMHLPKEMKVLLGENTLINNLDLRNELIAIIQSIQSK